MGIEVAIGWSEANVRTVQVRRDQSRTTTTAPVYMVLSPVAPPRLWRMLVDAAATSFERAIEGKPVTPGLLDVGIESASAIVTKMRNQLIEPHVTLDVRAGIVLTASDGLHVALTSGVRLYRCRGGVPERLYAKVPRPAGIAAGVVFRGVEQPEQGDLYVLGTRDAFTVRSIGNLASALSRNPRTAVSELCEAVIGPCRDSGIGASAIVLRVL